MKLLRLGDRDPSVAEARAAFIYLGFLPVAPRQSDAGTRPAAPDSAEAGGGATGGPTRGTAEPGGRAEARTPAEAGTTAEAGAPAGAEPDEGEHGAAGNGAVGNGAAGTTDLFDLELDNAVRAFQQSRGLSVDGIIGPDTFRAIEEARRRLGDRLLYYSVTHPFVGDDVAALQERLSNMGFDVGRADGIFGTRTDSAVRDFQRNRGLDPDGQCGPRTLRELKRLERTVTGGRPDVLRESVRLLARGPSLLGMVVAIDPGHGGHDPGVTKGALCERDLVADLASRLEARLLASGLEAYPVHGPHESPGEAERAARANEIGADLLVSLHVDASTSEHAQGVSTYYYGHARGSSAVGERFAALVQREIVSRTDMVDCRSHPKTWELLRRTKMPAVQIDLGYLTNAHDATALASIEFRAAVAEALLAATQRLFLPPEQDPPTGQLRVPRIAART